MTRDQLPLSTTTDAMFAEIGPPTEEPPPPDGGWGWKKGLIAPPPPPLAVQFPPRPGPETLLLHEALSNPSQLLHSPPLQG